MDEISLVRICASSFTEQDIVDAKNLLFDCVKSTKCKIHRKKEGKTQRDLEDIMKLFKETEPEEYPIFVAKNLNKLPPICWDHVDVSRFLKDIMILQKEILCIKQTYATAEELNDIKNELTNLKSASIVNNFDMTNVNTMRGSSKQAVDSYDSGPIGLLYLPEQHENSASTRSCLTPKAVLNETSTFKKKDCFRSVTGSPAVHGESKQANIPTRQSPTATAADNVAGAGVANNSERVGLLSQPLEMEKSFAQIVNKEGEFVDKKVEEWITVQRKRLRNKFISSRGQATTEPTGKFKAADLKIPLFINNVDKCTTASDIHYYILQKTQVEVILDKIKTKIQREYDSYKVLVPRTKLDVFMDAGLWPDGITFRRFVNLRRNSKYGASLNRNI